MSINGCSKKLCPMQVGCADNCHLTKEQCPYFTQDIDYQKVLKQIKAIVARNIFGNLKMLGYIDFDGNFVIRKDSFEELEKHYENEEQKR